jgi:hypothetical protein
VKTVSSPLQTRDLWTSVGATDTHIQGRATGAEVASADRVAWVLDLNLSAGLWPILSRLNGASSSVSQLVERINGLIADGGTDNLALQLATFWSSTAYGLQVDVNYPDVAPIVMARADVAAHAASEVLHTRLARELRETTGLSAATLGAAVGVTREQYQRWLAGGAISDARHGQLIYLHTIAADVARRLSIDLARVWWKTPTGPGPTPEDLLRRRQTDRIYQLAAAIPDPSPVVDGVLRGLPVQDEAGVDEVLEGGNSAPWSPYGESRD